MQRKKILILSATGGYGHVAAANTLIQLLKHKYDVEVIYPLKLLRFIGIPLDESYYNFCLANNLIRITNLLIKHIVCRVFSRYFLEKAQRVLESQIDKHQADIVISVIPLLNLPASSAACRKGLPFLMIATDNDLYNWVHKLEAIDHPNYRITTGASMDSSRGRLLKKGIPAELIEPIGLPLRPHFLEEFDKDQLREIHGIDQRKKVVIVMLGGMGSRSMMKYAKKLVKLPLGVHFLFCAGKNLSLAEQLRKLPVSKRNTVDIVPFTEKIHELMALSDLIITKPGPGTINEAIALKLPMLLDGIDKTLFWERANIELVHKYEVGETLTSFTQLQTAIEKYLFDDAFKQRMNNAFERIPRNRFASEIPSLISELFAEEVEVEEELAALRK